MLRKRILLVEDEPGARLGIRTFLDHQGYTVDEAESLSHARSLFFHKRPDVAILDNQLPDGTAVEALNKFRRIDPDVPLVILTGYGSIDLAVRALKGGAEEFLTKPVPLDSLRQVLERAIEKRLLDPARSHEPDTADTRFDPFLGESAAIRALERQARLALRSESPLLILGETGAGKGVLASWLQRHGRRAGKPFVDVNCAGLRTQFLESELFGHSRGAFTGAVTPKRGLLELADGGVLFLDEIGDLVPEVQAKLLKVIDEQRFRKLGETREREVDVQILAASSRDLPALCTSGAFRPDLYFRIGALRLEVPPLRSRHKDLPLLAETLLARIALELEVPELEISRRAVEMLSLYPWPGNFRELRAVLEWAALQADGLEIEPRHLELDTLESACRPAPAGPMSLEATEKRQIERSLELTGGRVARAAERLEVPRSTLYVKIKAFGIDLPRFQGRGPANPPSSKA